MVKRRTPGASGGAKLAGLFRERAEAAGAEVRTSATPAAARTAIASILEELGAQTIAAAADAKAFVPAKFRARLVRGNRAEDSASAEAGLVLAHFGIAETGTLVHLDRSDAEKSVWTLPPVCVAVLEASTIVGRLEAVLPAITKHLASPSGFGQVSLVTGPSRTADIENVLSIGVHGPCRLVIVLVDGKSGKKA